MNFVKIYLNYPKGIRLYTIAQKSIKIPLCDFQSVNEEIKKPDLTNIPMDTNNVSF